MEFVEKMADSGTTIMLLGVVAFVAIRTLNKIFDPEKGIAKQIVDNHKQFCDRTTENQRQHTEALDRIEKVIQTLVEKMGDEYDK